MLVTEALERSMAAVILSAAVRRDGEPDKWPRVCRVDVKSCCGSGVRMGVGDREGERVPGDDKGVRGGISGTGVAAA